MASDCTVAIDGGYLNLRVGAIILKDGKFLMVGNERDKYLYSVGGRIQFGESAEEAVVREVLEETGVKLEVDRLGFVNESFFLGDIGIKKGKPIYELNFFFYMKTPEDFEPNCPSFTEGNIKEHLVWVDDNCKTPIFPSFFREELKNPVPHIKHIVTHEQITNNPKA